MKQKKNQFCGALVTQHPILCSLQIVRMIRTVNAKHAKTREDTLCENNILGAALYMSFNTLSLQQLFLPREAIVNNYSLQTTPRHDE